MSNLLMTIYNNSPIYFQNFFASFEGYRLTKKRHGNLYYKYLMEFRMHNHRSLVKEKEYQLKEMKKLLLYAYNNSPFYQEYYKGIDIESIASFEDLKKLPILYKDILQEKIGLIYTIPEKSAFLTYTISETGKPLKFLNKKEDTQKRMAFVDSFKKEHGAINLEMKRATFSPTRFIPKKQQTKIFWRDNRYMKQRLYSASYCMERNAEEYVKNLEEFKPEFIDGLTLPIYELAKYINKNNIILTFKPIAIFSEIGTTPPHYREEIETAFDCPLVGQLTAAEGYPFIAECAKGNLHYYLKSGTIEVVDGDAIVTSFTNYGTPLIRYNIGKHVVLDKDNEYCKCGSIDPVLQLIRSKKDNFIRSRSKGDFTEFYLSLVSEQFANSVQKIQFIQNRIDVIDVLIESFDNYTNEVTNNIQEVLQHTFGEDMKFNIRIVEKIPNHSNEKFRLVINNLD